MNQDDRAFRVAFELGEVSPAEFDHRAHVRLAYIYLVGSDTTAATRSMRNALHAFIRRVGADPERYHETITRAWIMAVRHFMERTPHADSADTFIGQNPQLLDAKIMMTHYSAETLFSDDARSTFVEPDLDPIPRHGSQGGRS